MNNTIPTPQQIADEMTRLLADDNTSDLDAVKAQAIQNLTGDETMTNQEWLEYYRFHPSEFDAFIEWCESKVIELDNTKDKLTAAEKRVQELEAALRQTADRLEHVDELCLSLVQVTKDSDLFEVKQARRLLDGVK